MGTCIGDLHDFPAFWLVARRYVGRHGPSLVAEKEGPPTLKTATPVSCVQLFPAAQGINLKNQNRVYTV